MYDIAIVGAGIVGLAHAWVAAKAGKRVAVFDRDHQAVGASIRNFGFVTITGQQRGLCWERAMRSRELWQDMAKKARLDIVHRGLTLTARSEEAMAVLEEFMTTEMRGGCSLGGSEQLCERQPALKKEGLLGGLISTHEIRIEARDVIAKISDCLAELYGVDFHFATAVHALNMPNIDTSRGWFEAGQVIICSGPDLTTLYPKHFEKAGVTNTKLQMLRLAPQGPGWKLNGSVMNETSLIRYLGFSELASVEPLAQKLQREKPWLTEDGVHLIVVQSADGSLVIGDSHDEANSPNPFMSARVDEHILSLARETLLLNNDRVIERWHGIYPKGRDGLWFVEDPEPGVRLASITGGMGMSTAFAFAEDVLRDIL